MSSIIRTAHDTDGDPVDVFVNDEGLVEVVERSATDPDVELFATFSKDEAIRFATVLLQAAAEIQS